MNIEAKGYTIELDSDELWNLAFSVKRSIEYSLEHHWVNHQDSWENHEANKLKILRTMFNSLGRLEVYEQIFKDAEDVFKKFNNKSE